VHEDLLDHWLFQDRRNDLQLAVALRAGLQVDLEDALEQLGPTLPHWSVMRAVRLALCGLCGLRRRLGLLRHHRRAQLGVRCQHTVEADEVQPWPWHQRRCRCMNSSGETTKCVMPSRQGVLSFNATCPAALVCTRSLASAGRVM
jgi:hypothetical protein